MSNNIEDELDYQTGYGRNYHNPYSFTDPRQDTYLTTVTPRIQRSFIPLRDSEPEWDSYVDASQIDNQVHHNNVYNHQWPSESPSNYYDYTMSRDEFENMMLTNQYSYMQQARAQPRTYQNLLVSKLQNGPQYPTRQVRRFSNRMFPRAEQRFFNVEEAPADGTWAGSSDWVANWVETK